jgi:hypothetical protein
LPIVPRTGRSFRPTYHSLAERKEFSERKLRLKVEIDFPP